MFNSWQNCWFHCFPVLSQKNLKVRWFNFLKLMLFCYKHTDKKKNFRIILVRSIMLLIYTHWFWIKCGDPLVAVLGVLFSCENLYFYLSFWTFMFFPIFCWFNLNALHIIIIFNFFHLCISFVVLKNFSANDGKEYSFGISQIKSCPSAY